MKYKTITVLIVVAAIFLAAGCDSFDIMETSMNSDAALSGSGDHAPVIAHYKDNKSGAFSFTCDDGFRTQVANTLAILDPLGLKATFFIITLYMEDDVKAANVITWQQVRNLQAEGHEIGTHGSIAEKLHEATDQRLDYLINESWRLIKDNTDIPSVSYAAPGGSKVDDRVRQVILQNHQVMRGWKDLPEMRVLGYGSTQTRHWDDENTRATILESAAEGRWVIAVIHAIVEGWSPFKSADEFRTHCQWLASQSDDIWIAPMGEIGCYLKARNAARLQVINMTPGKAVLALDCDIQKYVYLKTPLTVVIPVPEAVKASAISSSGAALEARIKDGKILVDVVPDGQQFTVSWE